MTISAIPRLVRSISCFLPMILALAPALAMSKPFAEAQQTFSWFHAGLDKQVLIGVVIKEAYGKTLSGIRFDMKGSNTASPFRNARLYSSGKTPYFSPNSKGVEEIQVKPRRYGSSFLFAKDVALINNGWHHFWLVVDVPKNVRADAVLDASCTGVWVDRKEINVHNPAPKGVTRVHPFSRRVVAYYRKKWLIRWHPKHLTRRHMRGLTDLILFNIICDNDGNMVGGEDKELLDAIKKSKKLRGDLPVRIVLGMAGGREQIRAMVAKPDARARFAKQISDYLAKHQLDGFEIDWEYPNNHQDWLNMARLLAEIRPALYASGATVCAAITPRYRMAPADVFDQLDWINTMSYDAKGEHSTMRTMQADIDASKRSGVAPQKIVVGLPFYSNELKGRDWAQQKGYNYIVENSPQLKASENTFTDPKTKKRHYFNGVDMIEQKARSIMRQDLGGAMIWAYETDVGLNHPLSLTRALNNIIRPRKR